MFYLGEFGGMNGALFDTPSESTATVVAQAVHMELDRCFIL